MQAIQTLYFILIAEIVCELHTHLQLTYSLSSVECEFGVRIHDIFRCILINERFGILIEIALMIVPNGLIDNNSALVKIMYWRRIGGKPISEPMLTWFTDAYMRHYGGDELTCFTTVIHVNYAVMHIDCTVSFN